MLSFSIGGPKSALSSAIACGILLGVFEGVGVLLSRVFSENQRPQMAPCEFTFLFRLHHYSLLLMHLSSASFDVTTAFTYTINSWITVDACLHIYHLCSPLFYNLNSLPYSKTRTRS